MRKKLLNLLLLAVATISVGTASAQLSDANITGDVINATTGEHMPHVTVTVKNSTIGTSTDGTGHFFLKNLPAGELIIEASLIGYSPASEVVTIKNGETKNISLSLREDVMSLDQVVVTASRTEVSRQMAPTIVNVLSTKTFDIVGASVLAEGLNFQPGVRVEDNCQNCGFTQVRINGLEGHYSQILMDSRPIFSALTGVYGLEQIPANMIDRVEVVRGGGSALFGSSAIGGTINIITKEPTFNSAEFTHNISVIGGSDSYDNNTTMNATVVADNQKAGITIYGQSRDKSAYDANGDGFSEIAEIESTTIGASTFFRTGDRSKLNIQLHNINEYRRGGDLLDLPPHEAYIAETVDHTIYGGGVNFELFSTDYSRRLDVYASFQDTDRDSYYGAEQDLDAYGHTDDVVYVVGSQFSNKWDNLWFMPAELVVGAEYTYNDLVDSYFSYDDLGVDQQTKNIGAFIQNEWSNETLGVLIGGRFDKHNLMDDVVFSPRATLRYNPSESVNFRASYSTGFRAPQAFDEDLHISVVNGEQTFIVLSDDLTAERSTSYSVSADLYQNFGSVRTNLLIEGFYTQLDDVFALREISSTSEASNLFERYNASGAIVKGINIEAKAMFGVNFSLQGGLTIQSSEYAEAEEWSEDPDVAAETRMFRTPNTYGYITATYDVTKQFAVALSGTYTGSMLVQHFEGSGTDVDVAVETPCFFDMNLKLSYDLKVCGLVDMQINGGVQNILNQYQDDFDTGVERDAGYIYGPAAPRSFFLGIKLGF